MLTGSPADCLFRAANASGRTGAAAVAGIADPLCLEGPIGSWGNGLGEVQLSGTCGIVGRARLAVLVVAVKEGVARFGSGFGTSVSAAWCWEVEGGREFMIIVYMRFCKDDRCNLSVIAVMRLRYMVPGPVEDLHWPAKSHHLHHYDELFSAIPNSRRSKSTTKRVALTYGSTALIGAATVIKVTFVMQKPWRRRPRIWKCTIVTNIGRPGYNAVERTR